MDGALVFVAASGGGGDFFAHFLKLLLLQKLDDVCKAEMCCWLYARAQAPQSKHGSTTGIRTSSIQAYGVRDRKMGA
jgi:hypothetical protein